MRELASEFYSNDTGLKRQIIVLEGTAAVRRGCGSLGGSLEGGRSYRGLGLLLGLLLGLGCGLLGCCRCGADKHGSCRRGRSESTLILLGCCLLVSLRSWSLLVAIGLGGLLRLDGLLTPLLGSGGRSLLLHPTGVLTLRLTAPLLGSGLLLAAPLVATGVTALRLAAQEFKLLNVDLSGVAFYSLLILVGAGFNLAFDID